MCREHETTACIHIPAVLVDYSVHAALWCQSQNQGAFFILYIDVETSKTRQEQHLSNSIIQICGELYKFVYTLNKL